MHQGEHTFEALMPENKSLCTEKFEVSLPWREGFIFLVLALPIDIRCDGSVQSL